MWRFAYLFVLPSISTNTYIQGAWLDHIAVMQQDEIKQYLDERWLSNAEVMYRIFHFHTHEWPPAGRLHNLPDEQMGACDPAADSTDEIG